MKTLVLASLIAAAATGCVSDDDGGGGVAAHVGATWSINSLASNSAIPCPPGFDTAALYNQPVDSNGNAVGSPIIDLFDCAAGAGTSAALPATTYETWIEITNHDNTSQYAKSTPAFLDVTDVDLTYNAKIYDDGGYFALQWDLVGANSNAAVTCDQAGIADPNNSGVEINATLSGSTAAATDQFNCTDHSGITDVLPEGSYTLSIDAFTDADGSIGTAPTITNAAIDGPNKITDLHTITIPIDGL